MLEFNEKKHIYRIDGIKVPSVTEVTECLSTMVYKDAPPEVMEWAAIRGTAVHKATQALDETGEATITEDLAPYLKAYEKFLDDYNPDWQMIERPVNRGVEYAGTLDRYGLLNNAHSIVDIKTTSRIGKRHKALYTAAQNLYRMAIEDWLPVEKLWILQLKSNESYTLIELPVEDALANACLAIYRATKKGRCK